MKSKLSLGVALLFAIPLSALAGDINQIQTLTQDQFRSLSEDLGAALSYKPLTPAAPLGVTGFDLGVAVTATRLQHSDVFSKAGGGSDSTVGVPSLRLAKGLPLDIDVGVMAGAIPGTNIRVWGGELRYALVSGGPATPAVGVRASYTKLTGVDQLEFNTKGLDLSISKGFGGLTPYAGVGEVWLQSTPVGMPAATPSKESFSLAKVFAGLNFNLGVANFALEGDRTGSATSVGVKFGFRF